MRRAKRAPPGDRRARPGRPQALATRAASMRLAGPSGGRIDGSRRAAIDLPAPGGPLISRLWPPAAATSSARRSAGWPRRSARSGTVPSPFRLRAQGRRRRRLRRRRRAAELVEPIDWRSPRRRRRAPPRPPTPRRRRSPARRPATRRLGHRQRAGDRPDRAVERQLAGERHVGERRRRELPGRGEDGGRDREVEARAGLAQVGRGEVGGDPLLRELEAAS